MSRVGWCAVVRNGAVLVACIGLAGAMSACTKTVVTSYERPSAAVVDYAFVNTAADFGKYRKLTTGGLEIYYPESDTPPDPADVERIRASFREAFVDAIGGDYPFVEESGPDVLEIRAQIIDMKITGRDGEFTGSGRLRNVVARGELTFLMEIVDSESGEVLARAADRTDALSMDGDAAGWDEVDQAARHWAGLFRDWLDRSLGAR